MPDQFGGRGHPGHVLVQGCGQFVGVMLIPDGDQPGTVFQNFKPLTVIALQVLEAGGCLATFQDSLDPALDAALVVIAEPDDPHQIRVRDLAWRVDLAGRGRKVRRDPPAMQLVQMPHQAGFEFNAALGRVEEAGLDEGDGGHGFAPGMRGLSAGGDPTAREEWRRAPFQRQIWAVRKSGSFSGVESDEW
ncbi:hypothetical protein PE067_15905 [Paracoccus sp. DMF-8]|uniref:hypothetical protein n=1 Tax=Paracoccus sp. DMF-8 TaxID=3019445 RepID=UPI0023E391F9|nr:hypothetical protein [Paracoccus sp. DMF-8]MDF3607492.1 hypothetical protein [Paracoccus sp. DMF-8]